MVNSYGLDGNVGHEMTDNEFKKQGAAARKFYEKEKFVQAFMYQSLWRELMGLLETELFKHSNDR